jgi:hypothetical protein
MLPPGTDATATDSIEEGNGRRLPPLRLAPSPNATVNLAIGGDFTKFTELSKASDFFGKICPRY